MRGTKWAPVMGAAMMLAACGGEPAAPVKEEAAQALQPGLYEVSSEVTSLASTDNTTPATKAKQGDKSVIKACVSADGKPAPELFAEAEGDKCEMKNSYVRNGRLSAQMSCKREGMSGEVMPGRMRVGRSLAYWSKGWQIARRRPHKVMWSGMSGWPAEPNRIASCLRICSRPFSGIMRPCFL